MDLICLEMASRFRLSQTWQVATLHHVEYGCGVYVTTKDKGRHRTSIMVIEDTDFSACLCLHVRVDIQTFGMDTIQVWFERVIASLVVHTFPNIQFRESIFGLGHPGDHTCYDMSAHVQTLVFLLLS